MYIYLVSFENTEKRLLFAVAKNVKETFGFDVRVSWVASPFKYAYNAQRKQYIAERVVDYLSTLNYPRLVRMLAILSSDLYAGDLEFVFGFGIKRDAVVSTFRLWATEERLFFERVFKVVNLTLGKTFGLDYCKDRKCVMHPYFSLTDMDAKAKNFCTYCKTKLEATLSQLTL
jgi:archaemetzincin